MRRLLAGAALLIALVAPSASQARAVVIDDEGQPACVPFRAHPPLSAPVCPGAPRAVEENAAPAAGHNLCVAAAFPPGVTPPPWCQ